VDPPHEPARNDRSVATSIEGWEILQALQDGILVIDALSHVILEVNAAAARMFGTDRDAIVGHQCHWFVCPKERGQCPISDLGQTVDHAERTLVTADGSQLPVLKTVSKMSAGSDDYLVESFTDLSELHDTLHHLKLQSQTDALTGLLNHGAIFERLEQEVERAQRHARHLSLTVLDIDDFKLLNDSYGHPAGDEILRRLAVLLADTTRVADVLGRHGGDEFMLILPETDPAGAAELVARLTAALADALYVAPNGTQVPIRTSVGIASLPDDANDLNGLVALADANLYAAKRRGAGLVTVGAVEHARSIEADA
jgi:diguanylate cyclase (GGDEF)-like protein/PAS domain S-box-containing protein